MADEEKKEETQEQKTEGEEKPVEEAGVDEAAAEEPKTEEKPAEEAKEEPKKVAKPEPKPERQEKPLAGQAAPTGKHADLIKDIEKMSVADLAELVKALEDRFGVSAAPVAVAAAGGASAGAPEEAAAKASYTVHLAASGEQKIAVIKALREVRSDLGLKEAKDLVDGAPKDVAQNVPAEDAQKAKEKLEAAGAKVELK